MLLKNTINLPKRESQKVPKNVKKYSLKIYNKSALFRHFENAAILGELILDPKNTPPPSFGDEIDYSHFENSCSKRYGRQGVNILAVHFLIILTTFL